MVHKGSLSIAFQVLEQRQLVGAEGTAVLKRARNMVVRVLATSGSALAAADLLDDYLKLQAQDKPTLINFDTVCVYVRVRACTRVCFVYQRGQA